jgi:hypothetical protein
MVPPRASQLAAGVGCFTIDAADTTTCCASADGRTDYLAQPCYITSGPAACEPLGYIQANALTTTYCQFPPPPPSFPPRSAQLAAGVGCFTIGNDRAACCNSADGRTEFYGEVCFHTDAGGCDPSSYIESNSVATDYCASTPPPPASPPAIPPRAELGSEVGCFTEGGDQTGCCAASDGRAAFPDDPCFYNPTTFACEPLSYIESQPLTGFACP